jgi:phage FluMu protein Com
MQLRCTYCQTMFAISREDMLAALEHMEENKQVYYDAHCPKCRRANRVERARMERFFPDWKKAIKVMEKESTAAESAEAVKPAATPKAAAQPEKKPASKPKRKPAAASAKQPAAKASSPKGKTAGKKKK